MVFNIYPPSKPLQPFVQCYLEADSRKSTEMKTHTLFPNGLSGIFFNYGGLGKLSIKKEEYETPEVSIFGQIDQCFEAVHWPGSYSLGVLLKPSILSKYLRIDMTVLTNKACDGMLLDNNLKGLHNQLGEISAVKKRIELLDQYFIKKFHNPHHNFNIADAALSLIHQQGNITIKNLAHELTISERYLESQFKKFVGLTPKTYSLIMRFKRMEQQIHSKSTVSWDQMSFATDYYDQNHFIKDFKRFTGHTPSDYLLNNFEMGRSYLLR